MSKVKKRKQERKMFVSALYQQHGQSLTKTAKALKISVVGLQQYIRLNGGRVRKEIVWDDQEING